MISRRRLLLGLPALLVWPAAAQAAGKLPKNRLVFQVTEDDGRKWLAILVNIRNIQAELGPGNAAIALVAIGPGLGMLKADSVVANELQDALKAGVEFVACGNSMQAQHLDREDLVEGVAVTKAGYVEIMKRQQQGWTYLRP
jgi:intracellular sulfur oxidation DsrE/DsrF family protein